MSLPRHNHCNMLCSCTVPSWFVMLPFLIRCLSLPLPSVPQGEDSRVERGPVCCCISRWVHMSITKHLRTLREFKSIFLKEGPCSGLRGSIRPSSLFRLSGNPTRIECGSNQPMNRGPPAWDAGHLAPNPSLPPPGCSKQLQKMMKFSIQGSSKWVALPRCGFATGKSSEKNTSAHKPASKCPQHYSHQPKVEITQMSISRLRDECNVLCPCSGLLLSHGKKGTKYSHLLRA